jgi:TPR repeat protein
MMTTQAAPELSISELRAKASSGEVDAMVALGKIILKDKALLAQNAEDAKYWLTRASDLGDGRAMSSLGSAYALGLIGPADPQEASKWMKKAIAAGNKEALFNMGASYGLGLLGPVDVQKAKEYYEKAIKFRDVSAMYNLALLYSEGEFGEENRVKSRPLLQQAVDGGDVDAMELLARYHSDGIAGPQDREEALRLYTQAAELGSDIAASFLPNPMIANVARKLSDAQVAPQLIERVSNVLSSLEEAFFRVRRRHLVVAECKLAHFTTWSAIDKILPPGNVIDGKNCLRQYHVDYMNDPFEGQRLLTFEGVQKADGQRDRKGVETSIFLCRLFKQHYFDSFTTHGSIEDLLPSVFTVSLTELSDRLDLWRAYGVDGLGYAIVLPYDGSELEDKYARDRNAALKFADSTPNKFFGKEKTGMPLLYWVRYSDEEVAAALADLEQPLAELLELEQALGVASQWASAASCATAILLELLYLFKDEQYSTEREARALTVLHLDDKRIKVDERTPGHLYCETEPFLFRSRDYAVILGPKVEKQAAAMWNIRHKLSCHGMAANTLVRRSRVPYR